MLAIFNEDKNFTLLDSVRKKTDFLELVKSELVLNNVEVINGRAEEIIKDRREKYDVGLTFFKSQWKIFTTKNDWNR